jgi:lipopolysaccharide export LptBFGC system permease protein LptF
LAEVFEAAMVICFGISWPVSIFKSYRSRTNKGKSIVFIAFIMFGYTCGILSKIISGKITYVFVFYVLNLIMITIDCALYLRNARIDRYNASTGRLSERRKSHAKF